MPEPLVAGVSIANEVNVSFDETACQGTSIPGGEGNLEGCLLNYAQGCQGGLKLPEEGWTLGPWVAITFEGSGSLITVGNRSSPNTDPPHVACIKSFEFGYSDGMSVRVTIHDEQGGSFVRFMENLLKHFACLENGSPANVRMKIRFGWTKSGCEVPVPSASSRCYYALCDSVETNFSDGKFVFEITGKDLCVRMFEGGTDPVFGGDGEQAIPITQAIRQYLTASCPPNLGNVRFCKMQNGTCQPLEFEHGGTEGPRGRWVANGQDKLTVVRRWLNGYRTKDLKGFVLQYNGESPNGEVVIWEDQRPREPQGDEFWDENCIGVYIVNGGKKSPVLEFNPKIRWDFARLISQGGQFDSQSANAMNTEGSVNPGRDIPTLDRNANPCAGHNIQTPPTDSHLDNFGENGTIERRNGDDANVRALKVLHDNIEADLVIVGDPTILPPSEAMWSKNCCIILVNPYFITRGSGECGDWLATPVCNEVLSSKAWLVKSITHKIEAGKYTTTLGVYLTAPGIDTPAGGPIGAWSNGWVPPTVC